MSFRKPHLVYSAEPLRQGKEVETMCGKTIEDLRCVFNVEGDIAGKFQAEEAVFCHKCCAEFSRVEAQRYLSGVVPASWVRNEILEWM